MNVAIVGCGLIGEKRAKAARALGHRVACVADLEPERANRLASSVAARVCDRWQDAVASADVEAVVVATTNDALAHVTIAALTSGKHVLVEKPAARSSSELRPVAALAIERGLTVKVGFNHRFHPAVRKARELVDARAIGELMYVRGRYGHGGRKGYESEWRARPEVAGGGELIDQGIHLIDLSRWFLGDFVQIQGHLGTFFWDMSVDDNAFLALKTAEGRPAWLHVSCTEWKNLFCLEIFGKTGKLQIDGLGGSYGTEKLTYYKMLPQMGPPETTTWEYPFPDVSWEAEFADFADAVRRKRAPLGDLADAMAALSVVDEIYGKVPA